MATKIETKPPRGKIGIVRNGVTLVDADRAIAQAEKSAEKAAKCLDLCPGPVWRKQVDYYRYAAAFLKHLKTIVAQQNV